MVSNLRSSAGRRSRCNRILQTHQKLCYAKIWLSATNNTQKMKHNHVLFAYAIRKALFHVKRNRFNLFMCSLGSIKYKLNVHWIIKLINVVLRHGGANYHRSIKILLFFNDATTMQHRKLRISTTNKVVRDQFVWKNCWELRELIFMWRAGTNLFCSKRQTQ